MAADVVLWTGGMESRVVVTYEGVTGLSIALMLSRMKKQCLHPLPYMPNLILDILPLLRQQSQ